MPTQDGVDVKDSSTAANVPVDCIDVASAGSNPASGHSARQAVAIGSGDGSLQYAEVTPSSALSVADPSTTTQETTTLLGASGVFTGSAHDTNSTGQNQVELSSMLSGSQAGTLTLEQSDDNSHWATLNSITTQGLSTINTLTSLVTMRYWRARYTNGGIAQTGTFSLISTASVGDVPMEGGSSSSLYNGPNVPVSINQAPFTTGSGIAGSQSFQTAEPKDLGRTPIYMGTTGLAGVTAETLITCSITKGLVAQTAANSYTVSSGKILRVQAITASISEGGTTTEGFIRIRIGGATTGTVVASFGFPYGSTAVTMPAEPQQMSIPDGYEFTSGTVLSFSQAAGSTAQKIDVQLIGYEYTPV